MSQPNSPNHHNLAMCEHATKVLLQRAATLLTALLLAACAGGPAPLKFDTSQVALGQDSRVLFLIVHFTAESLEGSLRALTRGPVSSHYLVGDEAVPRIYRLVEESQRAWHAGDSFWKGHAMLNANSIGIEIVNPGPVLQADGTKRYAPFPPAQVDAVLALAQDIIKRHSIRPERVLGHSDIAPQRKDDPGPQFPWQRLGELGLIPWPDAARVAAERATFESAVPAAAWYQAALAKFGYKVPESGVLDEPTRKVLAAFQKKYRPLQHDGTPDAETAALLHVLTTAPP